jgi:hypothetical protein
MDNPPNDENAIAIDLNQKVISILSEVSKYEPDFVFNIRDISHNS